MSLTESGCAVDASKRRQLPAWIREGLEKMEQQKQKAEEEAAAAAARKLIEEEAGKSRTDEAGNQRSKFVRTPLLGYLLYLGDGC